MGRSIAIMNTKGGVGKSTSVMALAETLALHHGKRVLVIDSDSQTSISVMLMPMQRWEAMEREGRTLVDYLRALVLDGETKPWSDFIATNVSDVDDAEGIDLIPSHMELALMERDIAGEGKQAEIREAAAALLREASDAYDVVLVDCPPGISVLTEAWLRVCDFHMPPLKPDYLSVRGYGILQRFKARLEAEPFSRNIGLLINMKDQRSPTDQRWHDELRADADNHCFSIAIPRRAYLQRAADHDEGGRTYAAKYPADAGQAVRAVCVELLERLDDFEVYMAQQAAAASQQVAAVSDDGGDGDAEAPPPPDDVAEGGAPDVDDAIATATDITTEDVPSTNVKPGEVTEVASAQPLEPAAAPTS